MPTVKFVSEGVQVEVAPGTTLLEAASKAGIQVYTPCGGRAMCGKCAVRIVGVSGSDALSSVDENELALLGGDRLKNGERLTCAACVRGDMEVEVPESARVFEGEAAVFGEFVRLEGEMDPNVREVVVEIPEAGRDGLRAAEDRLRDAGCAFSSISAEALGELAGREGQGTTAAVLRGQTLLALAPAGDTSPQVPLLGAAFDIGTTTIAGSILDLRSGKELRRSGGPNPQSTFGADVISRIEYGSRDPGNLAELRRTVIRCIEEVIKENCREAGVEPGRIFEIAVAGNTVMTHLALGVDPRTIAVAPFTPVFLSPRRLPAQDVLCDASLCPRAEVFTVPCVSGYVGGDIVAGLVATGLDENAGGETVLYVDVGTNGEVVLVHGNTTVACSAAAGPAFEGARISCGMSAVSGAVGRAWVEEGELHLSTIGDGTARGVCGSGLLDIAAVMLASGVLDAGGRIVTNDGPLGEFVEPHGNGNAFAFARTADGPVRLVQQDIRELQLAKSAIRAGIDVLLSHEGIEGSNLDRVVLAGAFGSKLNPKSALAVGLLPEEVPPAHIDAVGNAAALGARMMLLSKRARERAVRLAERIQYVELSARADFRDAFVERMFFPAVEGP